LCVIVQADWNCPGWF
nr:Chain A, lasso peptide C24_A11V2C [Streptomyces sp.]